MAIQTLAPDAILVQTGLTGTVSAIQDDPASPDGNWLTAGGPNVNTDLRVSFPTPTNPLSATASTFRVWVRKTNHTTNPTAVVELWENGALVSQVVGSTAISSITGQLLSGTWPTAGRTAADIELRVVGTVGGGGASNRGSVEIGAVAWDADTALPSFSFAGTNTLSLTPSASLSLVSPYAPSNVRLAASGLTFATQDAITPFRIAGSTTLTFGVAASFNLEGPTNYVFQGEAGFSLTPAASLSLSGAVDPIDVRLDASGLTFALQDATTSFRLGGQVTLSLTPAATLGVTEPVITDVRLDASGLTFALQDATTVLNLAANVRLDASGLTFGLQEEFTTFRLGGQTTLSLIPAATYSEDYYLASDVTMRIWPEGSMELSGVENFSIEGQNTLTFTPSASLAYEEPKRLGGAVTLSLTPSATIGVRLPGTTTLALTPSASFSYAEEQRLGGSVTLSLLPRASLPVQYAGGTTLTLTPFASFNLSAPDTLYGTVILSLTPAATFAYKEDFTFQGQTTLSLTPEATLRENFVFAGESSLSLTPSAVLSLQAPTRLAGATTLALTPSAIFKESFVYAGASTLSLLPAAIFNLTGASYEISGTVTLSLTPAATLSYAESPRIAGSTTLTLTPAGIFPLADFEFQGNVTLTLTPISPYYVADDTWDGGPNNIWDEVSYNIADNTPVFILGRRFFAADQGEQFAQWDGNEYTFTSITTVLERIGLPVISFDSEGRGKIVPHRIKMIRGMYPVFEGDPEVVVNLSVGAQDKLKTEITWEGPYGFEIGEDYFADFVTSGRFISLRLEAAEFANWKLLSYELDVQPLGER
jgi:hypothetical protein